MFRFNSDGIRELFVLLRISGVVITDERDCVNGIEALCLTLYRLKYPRTYFDMMEHFGRSMSAMSRVFLYMIDLVHYTFADAIFMAEKVLEERI
ncbi:hypothetical protein F444_12940 [Phytophthora nicotianae P1976]|uniref:Uncharacterized protein n=1 Tax=Phytophthora nicotianae P1976 TaxID=1317066 RepID=A0A080ZVG5_PHYNI|nr:hypothetical protein F444_12940 [Phytophthora nicotianae P1976]